MLVVNFCSNKITPVSSPGMCFSQWRVGVRHPLRSWMWSVRYVCPCWQTRSWGTAVLSTCGSTVDLGASCQWRLEASCAVWAPGTSAALHISKCMSTNNASQIFSLVLQPLNCLVELQLHEQGGQSSKVFRLWRKHLKHMFPLSNCRRE